MVAVEIRPPPARTEIGALACYDKILLITHYSKARSLWKGIPALRCHVENMSNASTLRQAVMSHCYRLVLRLNFIVTVELLYDQAESDLVQCQKNCGPLPPGSAPEFKQIELNWNRLNEVWSSLQPDHETNKSPRRMQVSPPARSDDRSPIWNIWRTPISFLFRG